MIGFPGCKDKWQVELEKVSKAGLLSLVENLMNMHYLHLDREDRFRMAKDAKDYGRFLDRMAASDRFRADPDKEMERSLQRRLSAVKAARRRKKKGSPK